MTIEERFERIEHYTAGLAEERRKDREEYKALFRRLDARIDSMARSVDALAVDTRLRFEQVAEQMEATDRRLRELGETTDARIAALVSAIGQHVRQCHPAR